MPKMLRVGRAILVLSLVSAGAVTAASQPSPIGAEEPTAAGADCGLTPSELEGRAGDSDNSWLANDAAQTALESLRAQLEADPAFQEFAPSDASRSLIVLVEPGLKLSDPSLVAIADAQKSISLEQRASCATSEALLATAASIEEATARVTTLPGPVGGEVDFARGTYLLRGDVRAAQALVELAGVDAAAVTIEASSVGFSGRLNDSSPHSGGAGYSTYDQGNFFQACSSGFTGINGYGVRSMVTAGHCGRNPQTGWSGGWFQGTFYQSSDYPDTDISVMYDAGQTYDNWIYTDGDGSAADNVSTRQVLMYGDPSVGAGHCMSGAVSESTCGTIVMANSGVVLCDTDAWGASICVTNLFTTKKSGRYMCLLGDSGGPAYGRYGTNNAKILGTIEGHLDSNYDYCYVQKVSAIINEAGMTPATS